MNNVKILLLGKNGQIGWELQRTLLQLGGITALGRQELDLTDQLALRSAIRAIKPDLVVNAAAYTAVDKAEVEHELAMSINGVAPGIIAEEIARIKAVLIHYSTDYIFDGTKKTPYTENDQPKPLNIYGKTKLAGEEAILQTGCSHIILRTSWVYSQRGRNFLKTIIRLASEKDELTIINDQYGSPTWSRIIAEATSQIIGSNCRFEDKKRLYHLSASGVTTWYGFAMAILNKLKIAKKNIPVIKPVSTKDFSSKTVRPLFTVLDNTSIKEQLGIKTPSWQQQLDMAMDEM